MSTSVVTRPILRYHGGKWRLAPWVISNMPEHRIYLEPFGGAGSVLLRKPRAYSEIYNDLDDEVVNLFRVLRQRPQELARAVEMTPYARTEYRESFEPTQDSFERARRLLFRSFAGFGSNAIQRDVKSGFRANVTRSGSTPAHDWARLPDHLVVIAERLRGVVIENKPALELIQRHTEEGTLIYLDPPYPHSTRSGKRNCHVDHGYSFELTDEDHCELAMAAREHSAKIMVSGYRCDLYDALYGDWRRVDRDAMADGARPRVESLWMNF